MGTDLCTVAPLKGIPSQAPSVRTISMPTSVSSRSLARTPAGKKEGGVKLLEINEQPVGFQMQKRRKKQQGLIPLFYFVYTNYTLFSKESSFLFCTDLEESKKTGSTEESLSTNDTPDYAAGLSSTVRPPTPPPPTPLNPPPTPSPYQPPTPQPVVATPPVPTGQSTYARSSIPDGPPPTPNPQLPNNSEPTTPTTPLQATPTYLTPVSAPSPVISSNVSQRHKVPLVSVAPPQPLTKTVILQVPTSQTQQIVTLSVTKITIRLAEMFCCTIFENIILIKEVNNNNVRLKLHYRKSLWNKLKRYSELQTRQRDLKRSIF